MIGWLAFWRRDPEGPRTSRTLALVASLAVACPLLVTISVASVTQNIPDFDDGDWDGPDDDGADEKKLTTICTFHDGQFARDAAGVALIFPTPSGHFSTPTRHAPEESHLAAPLGEGQGDATSFRGPPRQTVTGRCA